MTTTSKKKRNTKAFWVRAVSLILAALLLGSVLLSAVLSNVY